MPKIREQAIKPTSFFLLQKLLFAFFVTFCNIYSLFYLTTGPPLDVLIRLIRLIISLKLT